MPDPIPVWIDCDPGHDDAFALLLAAHHPGLRLLGVSTVSGNAPVEHTTANAVALLSAIGREDVQVHQGAAKPQRGESRTAGSFHGATGLAGVNLPTAVITASSSSGNTGGSSTNPLSSTYYALRDAILAQPRNTVWLVAIGPLTNIAALLEKHPEVADWVAGLSVMGGAVGGGFANAMLGKDGDNGEIVEFPSRWAEFNSWCDPEAAAAVYGIQLIASKTTLAPLDLTYQTLATAEVETRLFHIEKSASPRSSVRQLFHEVLLHNKHSYQSRYPKLPGPPLHDILAVALLLDSVDIDDRSDERWKVEVVIEGDQDGRTVMSPSEKGQKGVRIPRKLDDRALWDAIELSLNAAEAKVNS